MTISPWCFVQCPVSGAGWTIVQGPKRTMQTVEEVVG